MADVLAPLEPHKAHPLYVAASAEVLRVKSRLGASAAIREAQRIADALSRQTLRS